MARDSPNLSRTVKTGPAVSQCQNSIPNSFHQKLKAPHLLITTAAQVVDASSPCAAEKLTSASLASLQYAGYKTSPFQVQKSQLRNHLPRGLVKLVVSDAFPPHNQLVCHGISEAPDKRPRTAQRVIVSRP
uniref:Uncharacterized protein n=1 Tax=Pararge aegeria TaxID=116150 RepID=S4PAH3_9NEOP